MLKRRLVTEDDFTWKLSTTTSTEEEVEMLRYVGGVDISFSKEDPSVACGTLVVLDTQNLQVVYEDYSLVTLDVPYVPGFLAFREVSFLSKSSSFVVIVVMDLLFDAILLLFALLGSDSSRAFADNEEKRC